MLKISMLGDTQEPDDCDTVKGGYDSPELLDHIRGADDSSSPSLLLEEVDIRGNRLTKLPSWLFIRFQFLRRVDASQNRIEGLPFAVWACTSLVELTLSHNHLSSLSCGVIEPVHLQLDGDLDQRPDTPASCTSESSLPSDMTLLSSSDPEHCGVTVHHLERWRDRVDIRQVSYLIGTSPQSSQTDHHRSCLKELDLSHNDFDEVPSILPCIVPCLERLNLSHNQLTKFGSVDCYPASLRLLDLSHNRISVMDLTEDSHGSTSSTSTPIPTPSLLSSTSSQHCYSPFSLKRSVVTRVTHCSFSVWFFEPPCLFPIIHVECLKVFCLELSFCVYRLCDFIVIKAVLWVLRK